MNMAAKKPPFLIRFVKSVFGLFVIGVCFGIACAVTGYIPLFWPAFICIIAAMARWRSGYASYGNSEIEHMAYRVWPF